MEQTQAGSLLQTLLNQEIFLCLQIDSKEMIQRGKEIMKRLKDPNEMCFTSLARIAAASALLSMMLSCLPLSKRRIVKLARLPVD